MHLFGLLAHFQVVLLGLSMLHWFVLIVNFHHDIVLVVLIYPICVSWWVIVHLVLILVFQ